MDWQGIIPEILTFVAGGGIVGLITIPAKKKKADVEVKISEIDAIQHTVEAVYKPLIEQQNKTIEQQNAKIQSLESRVEKLTNQLTDERNAHQKEIYAMQKQILEIHKALGLKAAQQARDLTTGKFIKTKENDAEA